MGIKKNYTFVHGHHIHTADFQNEIKSTALYNRSISDHSLINKQTDTSLETFVMNLGDSPCYTRNILAKDGSITKDEKESSCTYDSGIYWTGSSIGYERGIHIAVDESVDNGGINSVKPKGANPVLGYNAVMAILCGCMFIATLAVYAKQKQVNSSNEEGGGHVNVHYTRLNI